MSKAGVPNRYHVIVPGKNALWSILATQLNNVKNNVFLYVFEICF